MSWQTICDRFDKPWQRAEALLPHLAPELGNQPLYVVEAADVGDRLAWSNARGMVSNLLDVQTEPLLAKAGRWRGRGYAMIVDGSMPGTFEAIAIHEAAHLVERVAEKIDRSEAESMELDPAATARCVAWLRETPIISGDDDPKLPQWHGHESAFIRYVLHLMFRARRMGLRIETASMAAAGRRYGLSPLSKYEAALSAELVNYPEDRRLADLKNIAPPIEFLNLWFSDAGTL